MMRLIVLTVAASLTAIACKSEEQPSDMPSRAAPTEQQQPELSDEELDKLAVPVKEDFEEEAFEAIDETNLESQIDALEAEIEADVE